MDKYDKAIDYLTENPDEIIRAWCDGGDFVDAPGACLFVMCSPANETHVPWGDGNWCGCLTQIREYATVAAWTPELTDEICADEGIPKTEDDITVEHLPRFAYWQRRLDVELERVPA